MTATAGSRLGSAWTFGAAIACAALGAGCTRTVDASTDLAHDEPVPAARPASASVSAFAPLEPPTIVPREALLPTWPCLQCHRERKMDSNMRPLKEFHSGRVVEHGTLVGWCYRCHTADNLDTLVAADGTTLSFDEAHELCGSCHGDRFRDWREGIHGLTTGEWNGQRLRRSCTACHDPHSPKFKSMTPEAPPRRPRTVGAHP